MGVFDPLEPAEAELLAAIMDAPEDFAPRLIYADWLQDRDDPHGELIALQVAQLEMLAEHPELREPGKSGVAGFFQRVRRALPGGGSDGELRSRYAALDTRVREVLAGIELGWANAFQIGGVRIPYGFNGGFLHLFTLRGKPERLWESRHALMRWAPLARTIELGTDRTEACRKLVNEGLWRFRTVKLSYRREMFAPEREGDRDAEARELFDGPDLSRVRQLEVANFELSGPSMSQLLAGKHPILAELKIAACSLHRDALAALAESVKSIDVLDLSSCNLQYVDTRPLTTMQIGRLVLKENLLNPADQGFLRGRPEVQIIPHIELPPIPVG